MENDVGRLDFLLNNAGIMEDNVSSNIATMNVTESISIMHTNSIAPIMLTQALLPLILHTITYKRIKSPAPPVFPTQKDIIYASGTLSGADACVPAAIIEKMLFIRKGGKKPTAKEVYDNIDMTKRAIDNTYARVVFISSSLGSISVLANSTAPTYRASKAALNMYIRCLSKEYPQVAFLALHPGWVQTDMGTRGNRTPNTPVKDSVEGCLNMINIMNIQDSGLYLESFDGTIWPF